MALLAAELIQSGLKATLSCELFQLEPNVVHVLRQNAGGRGAMCMTLRSVLKTGLQNPRSITSLVAPKHNHGPHAALAL